MDKNARILCLSSDPLQKTPGRILRRWHNRQISPPKSREYARFCPRALAHAAVPTCRCADAILSPPRRCSAAPMRHHVASHPSATVVRKAGRTTAPPRCRSGRESRVASTSASPLRCNPQERQKKHPAPFKTRAAGKPRSSHPPILAHHSQFHSLSLATRRLALGPPLHDTGAHATASRGPSLQRAAFIAARMRLGSFAWRLPKETPARLRKDPRCGDPAQLRQPP